MKLYQSQAIVTKIFQKIVFFSDHGVLAKNKYTCNMISWLRHSPEVNIRYNAR